MAVSMAEFPAPTTRMWRREYLFGSVNLYFTRLSSYDLAGLGMYLAPHCWQKALSPSRFAPHSLQKKGKTAALGGTVIFKSSPATFNFMGAPRLPRARITRRARYFTRCLVFSRSVSMTNASPSGFTSLQLSYSLMTRLFELTVSIHEPIICSLTAPAPSSLIPPLTD